MASNGAQALELWLYGGFHLVFMDIQLPIMSGIEATKAIRKLERIRKVMTTHGAGAGSIGTTTPLTSPGSLMNPKGAGGGSSGAQGNAGGAKGMGGGFSKSGGLMTADDAVANALAIIQGPASSEPSDSPSGSSSSSPAPIPSPNGQSPPGMTFPVASAPGGSSSAVDCPVIIVALTASSLKADREEALRAGCNDFLTKPIFMAGLERKIIEWGCMQALIDFEGWRRWRRDNPGESEEELTQRRQEERRRAQAEFLTRMKKPTVLKE